MPQQDLPACPTLPHDLHGLCICMQACSKCTVVFFACARSNSGARALQTCRRRRPILSTHLGCAVKELGAAARRIIAAEGRMKGTQGALFRRGRLRILVPDRLRLGR